MQELPIEIFLSENGVCLSVPKDCGLEKADSLMVNVESQNIQAVCNGKVLPITLPKLEGAHCEALVRSGVVALGEFSVRGVLNAYCLPVAQSATGKQ